MSKNIRFKGLVATLAQIAADKFAGRIAWASDLARLIYYYTDSNYAVLARKDVAETFAGILASNLTSNRIVTVGANGQLVDSASLAWDGSVLSVGGSANLTGNLKLAGIQRISSGGVMYPTGVTNSALQGTGTRPMVALSTGENAAQDVATFRSMIGVAGAEWVDKKLGIASGGVTSWFRFATLRVTSSGSAAAIAAIVTDPTYSRGRYDLIARIRHNGLMSSALSNKAVLFEKSGASEFDFGYVVEQDDASEKRVAIYCMTPGYGVAKMTIVGTDGQTAVFENSSPITTIPSGYVSGEYIPKAIASLKVTDQAGSVARMVQASADGTQSAVDAATARATIDAAQTSHTHAYSAITSIPAAIDAIDGLTPAADRIAYYTGANAASLATLSAFGRSLIDDADAATARATIGAQAALPGNANSFVFTDSNGNFVVSDNNTPKTLSHTSSRFQTDNGGGYWTMMAYNGDLDFRKGSSYGVQSSAGRMTANSFDFPGGGIYKIGGTQVVRARMTGWAAATGTATRTTFDTSSVTLLQLAERVKALIDDLISHGLIGA